MTTEALLSRLEGVKEKGGGRWMACCPAHDDRAPSLSIRELDDGRVLVHCFGGCDVHQVVGAVGLELSDLFPPRVNDDKRKPRISKPWRASDVIEALRAELAVAWVLLVDVDCGVPLTDHDRQRAGVAANRVSHFMEELRQAR